MGRQRRRRRRRRRRSFLFFAFSLAVVGVVRFRLAPFLFVAFFLLCPLPFSIDDAAPGSFDRSSLFCFSFRRRRRCGIGGLPLLRARRGRCCHRVFSSFSFLAAISSCSFPFSLLLCSPLREAFPGTADNDRRRTPGEVAERRLCRRQRGSGGGGERRRTEGPRRGGNGGSSSSRRRPRSGGRSSGCRLDARNSRRGRGRGGGRRRRGLWRRGFGGRESVCCRCRYGGDLGHCCCWRRSNDGCFGHRRRDPLLSDCRGRRRRRRRIRRRR